MQNEQKYSWTTVYTTTDYAKARKTLEELKNEKPMKIHRHGNNFHVKEGTPVKEKK